MKDAALTVARDARTKACYDAIIANLQPAENMVELCAKPGGAFADALVKTADAALAKSMEPVVKAVMEKHTLTATWQTGIAAYNGAASKIPGCEPMDFDLDKCVLDQILATNGIPTQHKAVATRGHPRGRSSRRSACSCGPTRRRRAPACRRTRPTP